MALDRSGRDELINAAIDRDLMTVGSLLSQGHDPDCADNGGWSALHFAAQNNDADMVRLLLKHGASTSVRDQNGNTPLFRAVFSCRGEGETVPALLEAGADPDEQNDHGASPRSLAHMIANYDVRKFFD